MAPKDKKKKKAKKAPAYQTGAAELAPFGLQVGQLVRNSLGCAGTVLGIKLGPEGSQVWVRWSSGLDAPADAAAGLVPASAAEQLRLDIETRKQEAAALAAKWQAYEEEKARKAAEAAKAAAKKKKKVPPMEEAAGEQADNAAAAAGAAPAVGAG